MEKSFSNDASLLKAFGSRAKKIKQRYNEMKASATLADLAKIPATGLHLLKGDLKSLWAVKITKNDRICFSIDHYPIPTLEDNSVDKASVTDICIESITDYH
jgi:proteic killer suppression protein